jgi:hypothetical protein
VGPLREAGEVYVVPGKGTFIGQPPPDDDV